MRQWKTTSNDVTAEQKKEKILEKIRELAAAYVPEWQFTTENPDIGSVIALLYADEMEENIRRYHTLLERDYVELMNMLGISLKPAFPAHSNVLMHLTPDTIPGFKLKKGTKLLGGPEEDANLIFETAHNLYITESQLRCAFMASGKNGKVIPLLGTFPPISYIKKQEIMPEKEQPGLSRYPFSLFRFEGEDYGKYGVLFFHPHLFDVRDNEILMEIEGAPELVSEIAAGKYRLFYYGEQGFEPVSGLRQAGENRLAFRKDGECQKVTEQGQECSVLLLEPGQIPKTSVLVSRIGFSSSGVEKTPDFLWNGTTELAPKSFLPFGEILSLYDEFYIGHEEYFSKPGARISLKFQLDFATHMVSIPVQQQEAELKVIKKKPKKDVQGAPAEIYADEISFSYYNGTGWRRLVTETPVQQIFARAQTSACEVSFLCPEDWRPLESDGFAGRSIRVQITRADNCFYQPAIHHYPIIRDMKITYSYQGRFESPSRLYGYQGSRKRDLTAAMTKNPKVPLFSISSYQDTALYLGFDKKMEDGPISLLFQIQEMEGYQTGNLTFSYSTRDGFSRLKISDHTDGLSHTGTLLFMPPSDMAKQTLEGQDTYWIRITDEKKYLEEHPAKQPVILDIQVNAVEVDNIDTMTEEAYYIDVFGPNMQFALNAQNILSLELWVNEIGLFSESEMKRMITEEPEKTKAEYSFMGEIEEFYVKWTEVDNFDCSLPGDRHYVVDRMNSRICFGDGVHVQIPRNTNGIAFKVILRRCDGKEANIPAGRITDSMGGLLFVDQVVNPVQAYGGMNMETLEEALHRGTSVLHARNRLVSAQDYEREALNFSRQIAQAKVIVGRKKDGSVEPGAISLVLLMQDYQEGEHSFLYIRQRLKEHLQQKCELTAESSEMDIVQPVFVEISVEAWVRVIREDDTFEVQQELKRVLEDYLNPIENDRWEIGRMVRKAQIELRLNMEKGKALLHRLMVTARYQDETGIHETDIEALTGNPYIVVTSGVHKIHFEQSN